MSDVVREWLLPAGERHAARAERRVEALMRAERDSEWTPERRSGAVDAESRRYSAGHYAGRPWGDDGRPNG